MHWNTKIHYKEINGRYRVDSVGVTELSPGTYEYWRDGGHKIEVFGTQGEYIERLKQIHEANKRTRRQLTVLGV